MTAPVVAIIAQGSMGAAIAARLRDNGVKVLTSLDGRSEASAKRAAAAGMTAANNAEIAACDFILSIVPPAEAHPLAKKLAPALKAAARKPVYVDLNAVSPDTVKKIAAEVTATGTPFADGGIIGGPPRAGYDGPTLMTSGEPAARTAELAKYGLKIAAMQGGVGAASALKMSYAGLTKGLVALGASVALAADRAGVGQALRAEFAASQPALLTQLSKSVPDMFPKAYRWVAELDEIAAFVGDRPEREIFHGIARLYESLAADVAGERRETGSLAAFYGGKPS